MKRLVAVLTGFILIFGFTPSTSQAFTGQNLKSSVYSTANLKIREGYLEGALRPGDSTASTFGLNDVDYFYVGENMAAVSPWGYVYGHGWHAANWANGSTLTLKYIKRYVNA